MPTLAEPFPPAPFTGFTPDALAFFRELTANNERAWFLANKSRYETQVRDPLASLVTDLAARLAKTKTPLRGDAKRSLFRINRDVRFSKDKSPYKTHAGATLTRDGEKLSQGLLYIHIDPAGSFAAAGFHEPDPAQLVRMRGAIVADAAGWKKVEAALARHGLEFSHEAVLARVPKGFEQAPTAVAQALKLKGWIVERKLTPAEIATPKLVDTITKLAADAAPLLQFGWAALDRG
jgi:uncharacterized protein (TIGR02453 family)